MILRRLTRSVPHSTKRGSYILFCAVGDNIGMASGAAKLQHNLTAAAAATTTNMVGSIRMNGTRAAAATTTATTITTTSSKTPTIDSKKCLLSPTFEERVFYPAGRKTLSSQYEPDNEQINEAYEGAIKMLNTLQPNDETLRKIVQSASARQGTIEDTVKYLERSGIMLSDLEKMSFIHVAGTKGKGSTCSLTESILRAHGVHTGFFSSPHILATTERIRIDGEPISKHKFTETFWRVFDRLQAGREHPTDMPAYFKFMTIMSFHLFVDEQVDVAVLEVGIGGELDCTNIIRNITTIGITSLGLEHTAILGTTLEEIAWQKAGIIKPNANVYTHVTQPICLDVIRQRATKLNAKVHIVPPFASYFRDTPHAADWEQLNNVIHLNGSLAIQLAYDWLRHCTNASLQRDYALNSTQLNKQVLQGLKLSHWPGRCQIVDYLNMRVHLDGAHTLESICVCSDWFSKVTRFSSNPKVLIFNRIGDNDSRTLLEILLRRRFNFDFVCFVPNISTTNRLNSRDQLLLSAPSMSQMKRAEFNATRWRELCVEAKVSHNSQVFHSVAEAFAALRKRFGASEHSQVDVLVTGSIHLIGCTISALNELGAESAGNESESDATPSESAAINGHSIVPTLTNSVVPRLS